MQERIKIFISYRRAYGGNAFGFILAEKLTELGIQVFFDTNNLRCFNSNFKSKIQEEIERSDYVLILLQQGCMLEKENDVYLAEIRYALELNKKILMLPLSEDFRWENEQIPPDLKERKIDEYNYSQYVRLEDVEGTIKNLVLRFADDTHQKHFLMLLEQKENARLSNSHSILQKAGDIYKIDIHSRWNGVKRVSLLSIGAGFMTGPLAPLIAQKRKEGVEFRLVSVDYSSSSAEDMEQKKVNSFRPEVGYLKQCEEKTKALFDYLDLEENNDGLLKYRVTNQHITCTIQIVEHENPIHDYIFVEYLPICALKQMQNENRAALIRFEDSAYNYYYEQFKQVWEEARIVYEKK